MLAGRLIFFWGTQTVRTIFSGFSFIFRGIRVIIWVTFWVRVRVGVSVVLWSGKHFMSLLCFNFIYSCIYILVSGVTSIYFFVSSMYLLSDLLLICCLAFSINFSCVLYQFRA